MRYLLSIRTASACHILTYDYLGDAWTATQAAYRADPRAVISLTPIRVTRSAQ